MEVHADTRMSVQEDGDKPTPIRQRAAQIAFGLTIAVLSGLLLAFILLYSLAPTAHHPNLCTNEACISASALLQRTVDLSADPCQDFYSFACGGFEKNHPFTAETLHLRLTEKNSNKGNLFELMYFNNMSRSVDANLSELFQAVRYVYGACMHWHDSKRFQLKREKMLPQNWANGTQDFDVKSLVAPLIKYIEDFTGIEDFVARLVMSGTSGLLRASHNFQGRWLSLYSSGYHLSVSKNKAANLSHVKSQIELLCSSVGLKLSTALDQWHQTLDELAKVTGRAKSKKPMSVQQLQKDSDDLGNGLKFNWTQFVNILSKHPGNQLPDAIEISIYSFQQLLYMLKKLQPELQAKHGPYYDFIRLDVALSARNYLPRDRFGALRALDTKKKFLVSSMEGERDEPQYFRECTEMAVNFMPPVVFEVFRVAYVDDNFDAVEEMIRTIKQAVRDNVDRETWISQKSKLAMKQKLDAIHSIVSNPQFNMSEFKEAYSKLADRVRQCRTFGDIILAYKDAELKTLLWFMRTNEPTWKAYGIYVNALQVNAHYTLNTISIHLGILRTHIYNKNFPKYLLYGGIGSVIGHELGHAFDRNGIMLISSANGNMIDDVTEQEYLNRTQCLVRSYDHLIESQVGSFGKKMGDPTVTENFSDIVGTNAAFRAYKTSAARSLGSGRAPQLLPGQLLSALTPDQLFFIQDASFECTKAENDVLRDHFRSDGHTSPKPRVNGKMMHSNDFSRVFNCKPGDPMFLSADDKCHFW